MLHYTVNQRLHWAGRQYGHSGGTQGWLGVKRCQLCLQDTSRSTKWHRRAAVGHWVSLCVWSVVGWLIVYQDGNYLYPGQYSQTICRLQIRWYRLWGRNILMARPSTFLESRSWWGQFIYFTKLSLLLVSHIISMLQIECTHHWASKKYIPT